MTDDLIDDLIGNNAPKKRLQGDWSKLRPSNGDAHRHKLVAASPMHADIDACRRREQKRIFDELMEVEFSLGCGG